MFKNSEFNLLVGLSLLIVTLLFLGVYTSPTYTQKESFFNSIIYFLATLFIASITLVILWHGFKHFSVMLTIILAAVISLFGIKGAIIALSATYLTWGFVFTIEILLAHNGVESAIVWFKKHYTPQMFKIEYKIFYPMMLFMFVILEIIPHFIYKDPILEFNPKELYEAMLGELEKSKKFKIK